MSSTLRTRILCAALIAGTAACKRQESRAVPVPSATVSAPSPPAPTTEPAAPTPAPRYVGRFERRDAGGVKFAWSASTILGRFKGTTLRARLREEGNNFFQILVDGEPTRVLHTDPKKEVYTLTEGLPEGEHEVALYKRTEARVGEVTFLGFETDGTLLAPPPPREHRIEFIGDSITAGYGNEGPGAVCTFNPAEENEYLAYGALAARDLRAEHVTIAWSGKTIGQMTEYFEKALPAQTESPWNFGSWIPQLVVMNVGTNNFATYDPGEERYVRIYANLFSRVRTVYPNALIVCVLGPMLTDAYPPGKQNLTLAKAYMHAAIAKIKANGESNMEYLELPEQNHAHGLGCGFHPSLKTHRLMADRITAIARARLGW